MPLCQELGGEVRAMLAWLGVDTWDRVPCITRKSGTRVLCGFHTRSPGSAGVLRDRSVLCLGGSQTGSEEDPGGGRQVSWPESWAPRRSWWKPASRPAFLPPSALGRLCPSTVDGSASNFCMSLERQIEWAQNAWQAVGFSCRSSDSRKVCRKRCMPLHAEPF